MGASRNAELALLVASLFPKRVNAVIAFAPSSVSWSNRVLPYNSNDLKPSWTYLGKDIPYVPMDKISVNDSHKIETLEYWKNGLAKTHFIAQATIKVEKISGPIILFSGNDDEVWPSSYMADMIEKRLVEYDFKHSVQNIKFDRAGHLISSHPETNPDNRVGQIRINGKNYEFEYGGTPEGDEKARNIAKIKLMEFLEKI